MTAFFGENLEGDIESKVICPDEVPVGEETTVEGRYAYSITNSAKQVVSYSIELTLVIDGKEETIQNISGNLDAQDSIQGQGTLTLDFTPTEETHFQPSAKLELTDQSSNEEFVNSNECQFEARDRANLYDKQIFIPIPGNIPSRAPADTKKPPFVFVGKLRMTFPNNKTYFGTATIIEAHVKEEAGFYLLTAAHNLYDKSDGGKAIKVTFQQGLNGQLVPPYSEMEAEQWCFPESYPDYHIPRTVDIEQLGTKLVQSSFDRDYGLVKLKNKLDVKDAPALVALDDKVLENLKVELIGLYGWELSNRMFVGKGSIDVVTPTQVGYKISTKKGASGTAVQCPKTNEIVAIHVRGDKTEVRNYGCRLTASVIKTIEDWQE